ncbi:MAG: cation-translocating P-type ATPase [Bacillota bacterium]
MTEQHGGEPADIREALTAEQNGGLTSEQIMQLREQYGWNELRGKKAQTVWSMFLAQFKEFLVLLLLAAAAISLVVGEAADAVVIMVVVIVNAVLGVIQEFKAEKSLAALQTLSAPTAKVLRGGVPQEIPARELVPGDLILLNAGDFVPADARLLEAAALSVDQSALTGESVPVEKDAHFTADEPVTLAERANLVHMGTVTTAGRGRALVIGTGMETEIGRIAGMIQAVETQKTPLQKKLAVMGRQLGLLAITLCVLIFILGVLRGNGYFEMFLIAISLAVASIPEGLPAIVTIVLALGVQRMAGRGAIIRKLPAVETLGAATVICSDKTGTLTQNAMTVRQLFTGSKSFRVTGEGFAANGSFLEDNQQIDPQQEPHLRLLLTIGLLCNDAALTREEEQVRVIGDPTEGALVTAACKAGLQGDKLAELLPREKEYPFDSTRKRMSTVNRGELTRDLPIPAENDLWLLSKGAPDLVLERCNRWLAPHGLQEMTPSKRDELLSKNLAMASRALRVLAFAFRPLAKDLNLSVEEAEQDLIFAGFMGMIDPPRTEAKKAIEICRKAAIKVKMITGDYRETAAAIAAELGLTARNEEIITGIELDSLSDDELKERVNRYTVFTRVAPEHKVRIVKALKENGEIAAMTGDGVNDAPALKQADIGIAMGRTGTAVAKEAAEMVLADDNFATIVRAVQEGRVIFENIKKAVYLLLSCNIGEILTILTAIILGWSLPLIPIQILWINLVTDSLPALALGVDPPEAGTMDRPPRDPREGIFGSGSVATLAAFGTFIALITLTAFRIGSMETVMKGQTMAFATLALSQLAQVFNFRSLHESILKRDIFANRSLLWAVGVSGLLQAAVMFNPFLMSVFKVVPLKPSDWSIVAGLSLSPLVFGEIWKWVRSRLRTG